MFNFVKNAVPLKTQPISELSRFFKSLNKWPIDKAPKVSASSYNVGLGLGLLFHLYLFSSIEKFIFLNLNFFSIQVQIVSCVVFLVVCVLMSSDTSRFSLGVAMLLIAIIVAFVFFYYGTDVSGSVWYRNSQILKSRFLVLNVDFYLFALFFFGWAFKVNRKYSLESYTKTEALLYKSLLPTLMIFEIFTFCYLIVWRYINTTLLGYNTVMYLAYYRQHHIVDLLVVKLFFFLSATVFLETVIKSMKSGSHTLFVFEFTLFVLAFTSYAFFEFRESWGFIHSTVYANLFKFTYFKYFYFILMFNFLHAYLLVMLSYVFLIVISFRVGPYSDYYDLVMLNYKAIYFLMVLSLAMLLSVYAIGELAAYSAFN